MLFYMAQYAQAHGQICFIHVFLSVQHAACVSFCHFRSDLARYFSVFYSFSQAFYGIKGAPIKPCIHILVISICINIRINVLCFRPDISTHRYHPCTHYNKMKTLNHIHTHKHTFTDTLSHSFYRFYFIAHCSSIHAVCRFEAPLSRSLSLFLSSSLSLSLSVASTDCTVLNWTG